MDYDFIEVGTSNFDTLAETAGEKFGISVEPMVELIQEVKAGPNVKKIYAAIGNVNKEVNIYYFDKENRIKHNLPEWFDSSSMIGGINPNIVRVLNERKLPLDLVSTRKISMMTWESLYLAFDIEYVRLVKVDAEGMDIQIVNLLLDYLEKENLILPEEIQFEARQEMMDEKLLDKLLARLYDLNYATQKAGQDYICKKTI